MAEPEPTQQRGHLWRADRAAHAAMLTGTLAHELNHPLTAILSNAQAGLRFLERGALDACEVRKLLEAVVRESRRAAAVVRSVRAMLRREELPRARIDLALMLRETLVLVQSELDEQQVRLELEFEAGCDIVAEKTQIQQVAINLVLNALEAMQQQPSATRRLRVSVARTGAGEIGVAVSDTGVGIPEDELERVFVAFQTMKAHGMGMGLAISKTIVEAHGGAISVERNAGCGVTFRFTLPEAPPLPATEPIDLTTPETAGHEHEAPGRRDVICIVDDDEAVREGIERLLASSGFAVETFASPCAFLDSAARSNAACLVLDVRMAGMSGLDLFERLGPEAVPVVFLTGHGDVPTGIEAMKKGAVDFLLKPVDDAVLLAALHRAMDRHRAAHARAHASRAMQERLARLTQRERDVMERVVRGRLNKQIAAELRISVDTVKQHRGRMMEKMAAGSVAELVRFCDAVGLRPG